MIEKNKTLEEKCAELEQLLEEEKEKAVFYQRIAEKTGTRCLREVDRLSHIISEKEKAEEAYRQSEERFKILFDYAPDAYYINDLKGNFIDGNKAAENITGYKREEFIGKSFLKLKLLSKDQLPRAAKALAKNILGKFTGPDEFTLHKKDGTSVPVEIRTHPVKFKGKKVHVLGIARDITERKKSEAEKAKLMLTLMRQEKLASLGEMAAGIAHNLNNALSGFGNIDLIEPNNAEEAEYLADMIETYKNCANIVQRTLKLARDTKSEKTLDDIELYLKESFKTAGDFFPKKTSVKLIYESEKIQPFYASHYELTEAFLNIIKNGIEHTSVKGDGEVKVKLFKPENNYHCCIEIKDTGEGIAPENMDKLFNPFFTTKEPGLGTGLGLSTAYKTVQDQGGEITVESEPGKGATFRIYLPRGDDRK